MIYLELDDMLAIACEVLGLEIDALVHADLGLADSAVARPRAAFACRWCTGGAFFAASEDVDFVSVRPGRRPGLRA